MRFDEVDFFFVETVFPIELAVDIQNGLGPVDAGGRSEVLEENVFPGTEPLRQPGDEQTEKAGCHSNQRETATR